jgi:hypothetical protein
MERGVGISTGWGLAELKRERKGALNGRCGAFPRGCFGLVRGTLSGCALRARFDSVEFIHLFIERISSSVVDFGRCRSGV